MRTEPASLHEIATALVLTEAAVEQHHLLRLHAEFAITQWTGSRRSQLADEAVRRGAVTLADLRDSAP